MSKNVYLRTSTDEVIRFEQKPSKKLAIVVMKDSENQRHIPVWTPMSSDGIPFFEFLEAWKNNTPVQTSYTLIF